MSFDEKMVDRIREIISVTHKNIEEKKMFGGLCFMVNDKMCVGVRTERLMVRFDPTITDEIMEKDGCTQVVMRNKVMPGFAYIDVEVLNTKKKLEYWINLALEYNKDARPSKKRQKK